MIQSGFFTTPRKASRHKNNQILTHGAAFFEKGPGKKPLGFSIIGGVDCGQNNVGIFVKTIYPKGQSFEMDCLKEGMSLDVELIESFVSYDSHH